MRQISFFDFFSSFLPKKRKKIIRKKPYSRKPRRKTKKKSDPELKLIWEELREAWFPERADIDNYTVVWSNRPQLRTLASCNNEKRMIRVARELNYDKHQQWLYPLLYHEMCHAYLEYNVSRIGNKYAWHGKEFKALEKKHPDTKTLDQWIKSGGWATAVRSDRSIRAHQRRKNAA